jgi:hypothetical protein
LVNNEIKYCNVIPQKIAINTTTRMLTFIYCPINGKFITGINTLFLTANVSKYITNANRIEILK